MVIFHSYLSLPEGTHRNGQTTSLGPVISGADHFWFFHIVSLEMMSTKSWEWNSGLSHAQMGLPSPELSW